MWLVVTEETLICVSTVWNSKCSKSSSGPAVITSNRSFLDLTEEVSKASKYKELSSSNLACISSIYRDGGVSLKLFSGF